jgi:hypothetical protein
MKIDFTIIEDYKTIELGIGVNFYRGFAFWVCFLFWTFNFRFFKTIKEEK